MTETAPMKDHEIIATVSHDGARWVHKDLLQVWARSEIHQLLGDVESWCEYVKRVAGDTSLLTWSEHGLRFDAEHIPESAGDWTADCAFRPSIEWAEWTAFANGQAVAQKVAVERLEELADDIVDPVGADFLNLLRSLRASANATATTTLNPDSTSSVRFESDTSVRTAGMNAAERLELPSALSIAIPVLRGDADKYKIAVRLRVSVDASAHLSLHFAIQGAERVLEACYAERVAQAKALLGDGFTLLRGA